MKHTWSKGTIGELPIHIGDGNYSSKYPKSRDFLPSGIPFITASDLVGGRIRADNFRFISYQQHEELKKGHLKHGDVLVVTRGNGVGNVAFVDREYEGSNVNAQLVLLRAEEKEFHNRFLYYLLSSPLYRGLLKTFGTGSAQPQIPIWSLKRIELQYPRYSEQRAITHILGTLDDKIELNRRMNETLDAMVRAIFKSWFVAFDPVRAKAEGRDPVYRNTSPTYSPIVSRIPSWARFRRGGRMRKHRPRFANKPHGDCGSEPNGQVPPRNDINNALDRVAVCLAEMSIEAWRSYFSHGRDLVVARGPIRQISIFRRKVDYYSRPTFPAERVTSLDTLLLYGFPIRFVRRVF